MKSTAYKVVLWVTAILNFLFAVTLFIILLK